MKTVAQYVAERFVALGVKHVFGVPGDYAFPVDNALEKVMTWVGCANELNAGYAADGYARVHGAALLCTTYGVGELSALNAMMGAYAERVPIFHLVGIPGERMRRSHQGLHHSLGDGEFYRFFEIAERAACVSALLTPENVITEMERVIHKALLERRPAYLALPGDYAVMEVVGKKTKISKKNFSFQSQPRELAAATKELVQRLAGAKNPIILPAFTIARYGLQKEFQQLLKLSGIPYATMLMDKGVISESRPNYLGMYRGTASEAFVKEAVESADLILNIGGALFTDLSTGFFSHKINSEKMITLWSDFVEIGAPSTSDASKKTYGPVRLQDVLVALNNAFQKGLLPKNK
ncbi:MAG: alpha-keto acid decarboxylase family protein, partial [Verrucomicrobia bacterium]|nr:alpha-keto acid decarboxylase family protein [Verrucomicrobiota bacterium]